MRLLIWRGFDAWRAEAAAVELQADGLTARGTQIGVDPLPYRVEYRLDAIGPGFVTRSLRLEATGEG
ncbi:MAG: putative glycolipid-binding domain-containing protein, partial [Thermoleophilaceae bacterium]